MEAGTIGFGLSPKNVCAQVCVCVLSYFFWEIFVYIDLSFSCRE